MVDLLLQTINDVIGAFKASLVRTYSERFPDEEFVTFVFRLSLPELNKVSTINEQTVFYKCFNLMYLNPKQRGELDLNEVESSSIECGIKPNVFRDIVNNFLKNGLFVKLTSFDTLVFRPNILIEKASILEMEEYKVPKCGICNKFIAIARFSTKCLKCQTEVHNSCLYRFMKRAETAPTVVKLVCSGKKCTYKFPKNCVSKLVFDSLPSN